MKARTLRRHAKGGSWRFADPAKQRIINHMSNHDRHQWARAKYPDSLQALIQFAFPAAWEILDEAGRAELVRTQSQGPRRLAS